MAGSQRAESPDTVLRQANNLPFPLQSAFGCDIAWSPFVADVATIPSGLLQLLNSHVLATGVLQGMPPQLMLKNNRTTVEQVFLGPSHCGQRTTPDLLVPFGCAVLQTDQGLLIHGGDLAVPVTPQFL